MADIVAARAEVQKVVAFLVNRFGHEADVFQHLNMALMYLRDDPPVRTASSGTDAATVTFSEPELATGSENPTKAAAVESGPPAQEEAAAAPASKPGPPAKTRKRMGR